MSNWQMLLGLVAGGIYVLGFIPYLVAIYQGKTRPNRATWWIWVAVGLILVFSYRSLGATYEIWVPIAAAVCPLIIALVSLKYGEGGCNRFDLTCLAGAGISLVLWWVFSAPLIALFTSLTIDFLGALPTIRKAYLRPESEDVLPWLFFGSASLLNLFAIERFSIELFAYPFYLFCVPLVVIFLLVRPKIHLRAASARQEKYKSINREL